MFVKDDYSHTRGVGAVASMDATSPRRRLAAARAARQLSRRDRIMSRSTLGLIARGGSVVVGGEAGFVVPPLTTVRPGKPSPLVRANLTKLPGSVFSAPTLAPTLAPTIAPPGRPTINITAGGSGTSWSAPAPSVGVPAPGADSDFPDEPEPPHPAEPPKPKTSGNLLMYAAIGVGAWWLLTRK